MIKYDRDTRICKLPSQDSMTDKIKSSRVLKGTGIFLLVAGTLLAPPYRWLIRDHFIGGITMMLNILSLPMLFVGAFLYWRSRQYADKAVAEKLISDSKPDVLYLRSFGTDPSISSYMFSLITKGFAGSWATEEEQLAEVLQPFGDLVAIGKPGETLPTPGAARLYASDFEWQKVVTSQMENARLVVIRVGTSGGLLWEFKEVLQVVNPKKLLILIKLGQKQYESFRKDAGQIFKASFPKAHEVKRFGTISGFFRFSPSWNPNFLPLRAPFCRRFYKPYCALLKFTLRPVFEEYGLEWKPPRVSVSTVLVVVVSMGIGAVWLLNLVMSYVEVFSWFLR